MVECELVQSGHAIAEKVFGIDNIICLGENCPSNVNCEHKNKSVVYHSKHRMSCSLCKSNGNIPDTRGTSKLVKINNIK